MIRLSTAQKADLHKCFKKCELIFTSELADDISYSEYGDIEENMYTANLCRRAACMIYLKARDMKLIPYFNVSDSASLGFFDRDASSLHTEVEVLNTAMEQTFRSYGWTFPRAFNSTRFEDEDSEELDTSVKKIMYDFYGEEFLDDNEDLLSEILQYYASICLYHPKWSTIEMHKLSHPEILKDETYALLYSQFHTVLNDFIWVKNETATDTTIINDQYYTFMIYCNLEDPDGRQYRQSPFLHLNPGCIFLLDELDEIMNCLLEYK